MTSGERRFAERLEQKLDDDYLAWYDVPVGPKHAHPDFVVLHPRRGLLILEVKDWRLDTIQPRDQAAWDIAPDGMPKTVANPLEQARHYAHQVIDALERIRSSCSRRQLPRQAVLSRGATASCSTHITRRQFEDAGLAARSSPTV